MQVTPVELEQLLQSNPEIADAAVIPYVSLSHIGNSIDQHKKLQF